MILIFSQKSFKNMLKSYLLFRLKKKKKKKKERIFTQKKTLFMMSIELGNQFELELWMNMSVTARELAVFSRLVFFFFFFFCCVKTHFGMQSSNHVTLFFFLFCYYYFSFQVKTHFGMQSSNHVTHFIVCLIVCSIDLVSLFLCFLRIKPDMPCKANMIA